MIYASITGRLTRDAESKLLPNGIQITSISVASDYGYGDKKQTMYVNCSLFGKQFDRLAQYLVKGTQVGCHGELGLREWTNRDGATKTSLECKVDKIELLGSKPSNSGNGATTNASYAAQAPSNPKAQESFDDDIPF